MSSLIIMLSYKHQNSDCDYNFKRDWKCCIVEQVSGNISTFEEILTLTIFGCYKHGPVIRKCFRNLNVFIYSGHAQSKL